MALLFHKEIVILIWALFDAYGTSETRVRESKLYRTEEEAKKVVEQHQNANKWR